MSIKETTDEMLKDPQCPSRKGHIAEKIIDASLDIRMNPLTTPKDKAFLARQLVQATLPHSDPGNVPIWHRQNGRLILSVRAGWDHKEDKQVGYPYGTIPRLLLFWLTTEALRTKSRRVELGNSLADFMRELGLDPERGGKRSDAYRLHEQMRRLFKSTISFTESKQDGTVANERWLDMQVAPKGELWWDTKLPKQPNIWGSWVELGEDFYNALISAPVPLDMRALKALKKSPLALDLYAWATWRVYTTNKAGKEQFIPWRGLMEQLGCEYADVKNFKKKADIALRKVQAVYPELKVDKVVRGIKILPTAQTAIIKKQPKKLSTKE
jgi:hypothetical protein